MGERAAQSTGPGRDPALHGVRGTGDGEDAGSETKEVARPDRMIDAVATQAVAAQLRQVEHAV